MSAQSPSGPSPRTRSAPRARRIGAERGASFTTVMAVIGLVVFFVTLGIKMLPSYMTYLQVRSAMDSMQQRPEVVAQGARAIRGSLANVLYINDVRSIKMDQFQVKKTQEHIELSVDYETREHLFFNVDVVMHFAYSVALP